MKNEQDKLYGVIGLGRFGFALAKTLADAGKEILVIDRNQAKVNAASAFTDNAFIVQELTAENLRATGVQECDVVVVGIGEKIDTSILVTLSLLKMGVKKVIAKAISEEQGSVLSMLGAQVVYPEYDMAVRLANRLITPGILNYINLSKEISITEIALGEKANGKTVAQLDFRRRFGLNIIAVKRESDFILTDIQPNTQLFEKDTVAVIGSYENIQKFETFLED